MKTKTRVPEGGAIKDGPKMSMEKYSQIMKKKLGKEYERFADNVIARVNPDKNSKVLEIGPGPAWGGISLLKKRKDLYLEGIEASIDMIRVAKVNAKNEGLENRMNFFGKLIVLLIGTLQMGKMIKYWKSSIKASYTASEIEKILKK